MFEEIYSTYKKLTNLDLKQFFSDFKGFINTDYPIIVDYYSNKGAIIEKSIIDELDRLTLELKKHKEAFSQFKDNFKSLEYWELLDKLDTCDYKLQTIKNSQKWLKSNKGFGYTDKLTQDYILPQGETFEILSSNSGDAEKENDWVNIALDNDINEEKFTPEGGILLKINFQNSQSFEVNTVAGSISGTELYGKDYDKKITFENEDLKILDNKDTINQNTLVKLNLTKGSIPEFLRKGINKSLVGVSRNSFQYGTVFKDISKIFSGDNRFKAITLRNVVRDQDNQYFEFDIETRLGDIIEQTLAV